MPSEKERQEALNKYLAEPTTDEPESSEAEPEEEPEEPEESEEEESEAVSSSMVSEWSYNPGEEVLTVTFNNGKTESYGCTPAQWKEAKEAPSAGRWMHANVL